MRSSPLPHLRAALRITGTEPTALAKALEKQHDFLGTMLSIYRSSPTATQLAQGGTTEDLVSHIHATVHFILLLVARIDQCVHSPNPEVYTHNHPQRGAMVEPLPSLRRQERFSSHS